MGAQAILAQATLAQDNLAQVQAYCLVVRGHCQKMSSSKRSRLKPPSGAEQETSRLMELLCSSILLRAIPQVRRLALLETLRKCTSNGDAKQMVLENITGSPYIPDGQKD